MDLQLNIALTTLQMQPADRPDASVDSVAGWLREKSKVFKPLDDAILTDVARNCSLQMLPANHVLIRQGEIGDCFYIILQGQVAVYICTDLEPGKVAGHKEEPVKKDDYTYSRKHAGVGEDEIKKKEEKLDRNLFGKHILNLGMGASFGELALINDDSVRNASVIVDETTHLICIDRDLYNRSLKGFQARDFEDRNNFIETHPLFSNWPWRLKRQVAMSLERSTYDFDSLISKQGKPANTVYFIFRGTARLVYNSATLHSSTGGIVPRPAITYNMGTNYNNMPNNGRLSRTTSVVSTSSNSNNNGGSITQRQQEICSITNGEAIGDLEMFYPIDNYLFSTIAAAPTEVLALSQKNMSRFLENKVITKMMVDLLSHAYYRLKDRVERVNCNLLTCIFNNIRQIVDCVEAKRAQEAQNKMKRVARRGITTAGGASKQVLTPRTATSSTGMRPVTVSPPSSGFRRFINHDSDDETSLHYSTNHGNEELVDDYDDEDVPPEAKETVFPDWETSDERLRALEDRIRKFNSELLPPESESSTLPINVMDSNSLKASSDGMKNVVEMRRYTISGQQGAPRAGSLVKVRLSQQNKHSSDRASASPSPPTSAGRMTPSTPTTAGSRRNTGLGQQPFSPQRNVTFSREVTITSIGGDNDASRPRSYSLSMNNKR